MILLHVQNNRHEILQRRNEFDKMSRNIERDIKKRWGWTVSVFISLDGSLSWDGNRNANKDRYDMYPGKTKEEADEIVMGEILSIIRKYIPNFQYTGYEQSGKHYSF